MKLKHTEYIETLLALSTYIDRTEPLRDGTYDYIFWRNVRETMDKILSHHFDTKETELMKKEDEGL